jgi:hypothetical protein
MIFNPHPLIDLSFEALRKGDHAASLRFAKMVLAREPEQLGAHHLMLLATYGLVAGERLIEAFRPTLLLHRDAPRLHRDAGLSLEKAGQVELAEQIYQSAALLEYWLRPDLRAGFSGPFNGQMLRRAVYRAIAASGQLAEVIETGTHRATTTEFLARHASCPVKTCEKDGYFHALSRIHIETLRRDGLDWAGRIELHRADTRGFLSAVLSGTPEPQGFSFCYLDAHGDYIQGEAVENPLLGEIRLVRAARKHVIVMIDDFEVPGDPVYIHEPGNDMATVAPLLPSFDAWFHPLGPDHDSGHFSGSIMLSGSPETSAMLELIPELRRG